MCTLKLNASSTIQHCCQQSDNVLSHSVCVCEQNRATEKKNLRSSKTRAKVLVCIFNMEFISTLKVNADEWAQVKSYAKKRKANGWVNISEWCRTFKQLNTILTAPTWMKIAQMMLFFIFCLLCVSSTTKNHRKFADGRGRGERARVYAKMNEPMRRKKNQNKSHTKIQKLFLAAFVNKY